MRALALMLHPIHCMSALLIIVFLFAPHFATAAETPPLMGRCQLLLQRYEKIWREEAFDNLSRYEDRDLRWGWNFEGDDRDLDLGQFPFRRGADVSSMISRIRFENGNAKLEIRDESTNVVHIYPLKEGDLVTHIEATQFASKGNDDNQTNTLAFSTRTYANVQYPIGDNLGLVLAVHVLPFQPRERLYVGKRSECVDDGLEDFWFNAQGERFCLQTIGSLTPKE